MIASYKKLGVWLLPVVIIIFSFLVLIVSSDYLNRIKPGLLFVLGIGALVAFFLSLRPVILLWFTTIMALFASGLVRLFFPDFSAIWWVVYGSSLLMYLVAVINSIKVGHSEKLYSTTMQSFAVGSFIVLSFISSAYSFSSIGQLVVAIKSLFLMGGVWALLNTVQFNDKTIRVWLRGALVISLVQWIPVIYQYVFVRSYRIEKGFGTVSAADSVVGTFGGSMESGGLTAVLAFFLVSTILFILSYNKESILSGKKFYISLLLVSFPLLLMEVKVIFFYIPLGLLILYRKEIIRKPMFAISFFTISTVVIIGILASYQALHWSGKSDDFSSNLDNLFGYSFESDAGYMSSQLGILTRRGAVEYWWKQHENSGIGTMLVGHGLGSGRTSGRVLGVMAHTHSPKIIDRTGLTLMLWEVGILGVVLLLWILLSIQMTITKIVNSGLCLPESIAIANGLSAVIPLFVLSFLYRNDIPYAAPMMFLLMSCFGLVSWLNKSQKKGLQI
ncbi:MAG: hypothetical protein ABW162_02510 [Candidatus Sedimenticola sp. PURPLELP]